jgi:predicted RNA-binding Zn-ribbon protein involved in translation (DUF1610 family)
MEFYMFCSSCGAKIDDGIKFCPNCGTSSIAQSTVVAEKSTDSGSAQIPVQKSLSDDEAFCSSCGAVIKKEAEICPKCGVRQKPANGGGTEINSRWTTLLILSIFLGELGVDRFYVGKIGTGILKLVTVGGCGVWWLIDIITIVQNKFTDSDGNVITKN